MLQGVFASFASRSERTIDGAVQLSLSKVESFDMKYGRPDPKKVIPSSEVYFLEVSDESSRESNRVISFLLKLKCREGSQSTYNVELSRTRSREYLKLVKSL